MIHWIRISTSITADPSLDRLASSVRIAPDRALGLVVAVLCQMPAHAKDGNLSAIPDSTLEYWARWHGKVGAFASAFRAEFCDAAGVVRSWERYNGRAIREAEYDAERKRAAREARRKSPPTPEVESGGPSGGLPAERREMSAVTRRDETGRTTSSSSARDALLALVPNRPTWEAEMAAMERGMPGHIHATDAQIEEAASELLAERGPDAPPLKLRQFKRFVEVVAHPREARSRPTLGREDSLAEAQTVTGQILALAREHQVAGQGMKRSIRNDDVEALGPVIAAAYRAVGGARRFLETPADKLGLLHRDFATALATAKRQSAA